MVKTESELIEVQGQILGRNLMENAGDRSFEKGPHILNPVSMDISGLHIGFLMVHGIMDKLRGIKPQISRELVSMDFGPRFSIIADESCKGAGLNILNRLHKDFA